MKKHLLFLTVSLLSGFQTTSHIDQINPESLDVVTLRENVLMFDETLLEKGRKFRLLSFKNEIRGVNLGTRSTMTGGVANINAMPIFIPIQSNDPIIVEIDKQGCTTGKSIVKDGLFQDLRITDFQYDKESWFLKPYKICFE